jgi:LysM repeat protein
MSSNKFGRMFVPVFVIAALVLALFSAAPALAQETTGPVTQQPVPQEWLEDFEFENGRVYYILAQGDNLQDVADRFGTTVEDLRDANDDFELVDNDDEYVLYVGQPVLIPEDATVFEDYDFDVDMEADADAEDTGTFNVNAAAEVDWDFETTDLEQLQAGEVYYIVESGDTLQGIANLFDTTVEELQTLNAAWFTDQLYVGQPVQLPEEVFPLTPTTGEQDATATPDAAAPAATATPDAAAPAAPAATATPAAEATAVPTQAPATGTDQGSVPVTGVDLSVAPDDINNRIFMFQEPRGTIVGEYYIVDSGDYLILLAARMGVTAEELLNANPQIGNPNMLFRGEAVRVPGAVSEDFRDDPRTAEADFTVVGTIPADRLLFAQQTGQQQAQQGQVPVTGVDLSVTQEDLAGRTFMFQEQRCTIVDGYYIVNNGDHISNLADRMGVTVQELLDVNQQIQNPSMLFRGEAIRIPAGVASDFLDDPKSFCFDANVDVEADDNQ